MLLAYPARRNDAASGERDGCAEDGFGHENTLGMMTKCAMAEVGDDFLGFVEPVVNALVVSGNAAPFLHAGEGVMVRMRHVHLPQNVWLKVVKSENRTLNSRSILLLETLKTNSPKAPSLFSHPPCSCSR